MVKGTPFHLRLGLAAIQIRSELIPTKFTFPL